MGEVVQYNSVEIKKKKQIIDEESNFYLCDNELPDHSSPLS